MKESLWVQVQIRKIIHFNLSIQIFSSLTFCDFEAIWLLRPAFVLEGWKYNFIEKGVSKQVLVSIALCSTI